MPLLRSAADSGAVIFGISVAITPPRPTIRGNDIDNALLPMPSTVLTVNILFSSFAIQRTKSATAPAIPSHVAPRPRIISYAAL